MTPGDGTYTATEMMTIAAARALRNDDVCFVGIGAPSAACNLARLTHAPDITLIYESGTIGTALAIVATPLMGQIKPAEAKLAEVEQFLKRTIRPQDLQLYITEIGVTPDFVLRNNLRVSADRFRKELLRDQRRTVPDVLSAVWGRMDTPRT